MEYKKMCNPLPFLTNSMMYGGGYMTGSGMETTAMLFSGVNSLFNYGGCGGYYGYDNYGCGCNNSNNNKAAWGWMTGMLGANLTGLLINKGIQNHNENVAAREARTAQNAADVETALTILNLTENEAIIKGAEGINAREIKDAYNDQALKTAKNTKKDIENKITNLETDITNTEKSIKEIKNRYYNSGNGMAALRKQLNDLESTDPKDNNKINEVRQAIESLEAEMKKCEPGGDLYEALKAYKESKTQYESDLNDVNTLIETITQKQQEFKEAKQTVINNLNYLIDKQTKAKTEAKETFNNAIDDVDSNWVGRWGASNARQLIKDNYDTDTDISKFTDTDWQKLLCKYKKSNSPEERGKIRDFLIAKQDEINGKSTENKLVISDNIKVLLNSIINNG